MIASTRTHGQIRSQRANDSQVRVNRPIKEFYALRDLVFDPGDPVEILLARLHITEPSHNDIFEEEEAAQGSIEDTERASNQDSEYASNEKVEHESNHITEHRGDQDVDNKDVKDVGQHESDKIKDTKKGKALEEEQLAAATWYFLDQSDLLPGFLNRGLLPPPPSASSPSYATKPRRKRKPKQNTQDDVKQVDVLVSVHVRDICRPAQELLPPYHIEFNDVDGRSFGYLFSRLPDERTKFLASFGVRKLGGIKKFEATYPCALDERPGAKMKRRDRCTEYKLEGIADWARMEKLWRDFLEDTNVMAEFESRGRDQGRWVRKEKLDEDVNNDLKELQGPRCITPHSYAEVILYFWPEYEAPVGEVSEPVHRKVQS